MKTIITAAIVLLGTLCIQAGEAGATLMTLGDPFNSGSWSQSFKITDSRRLDRIEAFVLTGNKFKTGFENINKSDWRSSVERPDYTHAKGSDTEEISFDLHFDGEHNDDKDVVHTDPVEIVVLTWCDDKINEDIHGSYDGDKWHFDDHSEENDHHDREREEGCDKSPTPVPEPGTIVLLGTGLLGLAAYGRKRIKK